MHVKERRINVNHKQINVNYKQINVNQRWIDVSLPQLQSSLQASPRLWQRADDEVIRVVDEITDELGGKRAIKNQGVPVALIHMIAGSDGFILVAQREGTLWVALEINPGGKTAATVLQTKRLPARRISVCSALRQKWPVLNNESSPCSDCRCHGCRRRRNAPLSRAAEVPAG